MNADQGSAFIFERSGTTWTQRQQLIDNSSAAGDQFGSNVGISGDKAVIGAPFSDTSTPTPFSEQGKSLSPTAADQGAAIFFVNAPLAPTAANISVSGRVLSNNSAVLRATVSLTDSRGIVRNIKTNTFGYFRFDDIRAGETVIMQVTAKGYTFAPQVITLNDDLTELEFNAL